MKKITTIFVFALYLLSVFSVFAINQNSVKTLVSDGGNVTAVNSENRKLIFLKGIDRAIMMLEINGVENTTNHLIKVLAKIESRDKIVLNELENLTFAETPDGRMGAFGIKKAKLFGFIGLNKKVSFTIMENGGLQRNKKFFDFLWAGLD